MKSFCKLDLNNLRYTEVYELENGQNRVDLREWGREGDTEFPTKKGISLKLDIFKSLELSLDMIDSALQNKEDLQYHMGSNIFCTVKKDSPCVDIRQYWRPPNQKELVPTKKGLCLRPVEYRTLKSRVSELHKVIPELQTLVPCFLREDHMNQLGMLQCSNCNPLEYESW